jgi:hypothetical protein
MASTLTEKFSQVYTTPISVTIDSGINVGFIVGVAFDVATSTAAKAIESVTLGTQPMIQVESNYKALVGSQQSGFAVYYLASVTAGTYDLTIKRDTTDDTVCFGMQVTELEALSPIDTTKESELVDSATSPDADITITDSAFVVSFAAVAQVGAGSATANSGWSVCSARQQTGNSPFLAYVYRDYTGLAPTTTTDAEVLIGGAGANSDWKQITIAIKTNATQIGTVTVNSLATKNMLASKRRYRP